jgi:hypothetical protein
MTTALVPPSAKLLLALPSSPPSLVLTQISFYLSHNGKTLVSIGILWVDPDSLTERIDGRIQIALVNERITEVVVRFGILWVDPGRLVVRIDGRIKIALGLERKAEVAIRT